MFPYYQEKLLFTKTHLYAFSGLHSDVSKAFDFVNPSLMISKYYLTYAFLSFWENIKSNRLKQAQLIYDSFKFVHIAIVSCNQLKVVKTDRPTHKACKKTFVAKSKVH